MFDQGIDEYTAPCNSFSDDDHWDHWDNDDHWDHWDHDDHGQENDLWSILIQDEVFKILNHDSYLIVIFQCQEVKWALANYENDFTDGMEHMSHDDLVDICEQLCRDSSSSCHQLEPDDFLNRESCNRNGFRKLTQLILDI